MTITITTDTALAALEKAVNLKGEDYNYVKVNNSCVYRNGDGEPMCIVGYALHFLGFDLNNIPLGINAASISIVLERLNVPVEPDDATNVRDVFEVAQQIQDNGGTWGDAVHKARKAVNR